MTKVSINHRRPMIMLIISNNGSMSSTRSPDLWSCWSHQTTALWVSQDPTVVLLRNTDCYFVPSSWELEMRSCCVFIFSLLKSLLKNIFIQYILIIFFPLLQFLTNPPHLPTHPTSCSLSKKKKKKAAKNKNQNRQTKKRKIKSVPALVPFI